MIKKLCSLLVIAALASACNTETDSERPTVDLESPADGEVVTTDSDLRLVATILDNTGLLQYKFTVAGIDSLNDVGADSTFSYIHVESIANGTSGIFLDELIPLDDNVFNGEYFATLTAIDVEGNEAFRDTVKFSIQNSIDSEPPVFNVGGVVAGDTLNFGEGVAVIGEVTDPSLIFADIYVGRIDGSFELVSFGFSGVENNTVNYGGVGWYFEVDSTWSQGAYHMYFTAWDNYSGVSQEIPFHVSY